MACLSEDIYLSVRIDTSGMRNHTSVRFTKFLFASYLRPWLSLPSFGGIGYILLDVDGSCYVSVAEMTR